MSTSFNYKHLYYFWVVAKEGGISRAADKLDMAVQTVSAQVRELERSLGYALLKPAGRGLVLTDAGQAAMQQADQIFQLGENLPARVRDAASTPTIRLAQRLCQVRRYRYRFVLRIERFGHEAPPEMPQCTAAAREQGEAVFKEFRGHYFSRTRERRDRTDFRGAGSVAQQARRQAGPHPALRRARPA